MKQIFSNELLKPIFLYGNERNNDGMTVSVKISFMFFLSSANTAELEFQTMAFLPGPD